MDNLPPFALCILCTITIKGGIRLWDAIEVFLVLVTITAAYGLSLSLLYSFSAAVAATTN